MASINLNDRTIVITGGARGLGAAFARACAAAGARIILADILEDLVHDTASLLRSEGFAADGWPVDIAEPTSVDGFADVVREKFGAIDGLINNAALATGIGGVGFENIDIATWDRVMSINVRGTWLMTKALAPLLRGSTRGGRIVNMASDTALWGAPNLLHYVASKGAVISMTRSLARELGPDQITVNAIAPGLVRVEATDYVPEERKSLYIDRAAIHRPHMPDDTVGAAVFLLSDAAGFITGQTLPVNGGFISV